MQPNRIVRLGVIVLVIAAVAVVLYLKQVDSASSRGESAGAISNMVLTDGPTTPAPVPPSGSTDSAQQDPARSGIDRPLVDAALPRLLDLGADKCIPCKKMAPILETLREDFAGQFEVVFIDVWKNKNAAGPYGIKLIPTQIFFDAAGDELFRHEGFFSREDILTTWSDLGHVFEVSLEGESG